MNAAIEIKPYSQRLRVPYRWSKGVQHTRGGLLIRIELDGAVGWGEAALPPHVVYDGGAMANQCRALVENLDPGDASFLTRLEEREVGGRLRCGIATALLSARATARNVPLSSLIADMGPVPADRVPINDLVTDETPDACVARTAEAVERGQTVVKVKCTPERDLDLRRIGAIRSAFPRVRIRLDPNESWPIDWALAQLEAMARYNIDYVEEPLPRGTPMSLYAKLRKASPIPIALDDSVRSVTHAEDIIEIGAADVFIIKAQRVGGPDKVKRIIDIAHAAGIRCVVTASLESAVGLHLALHCAALLPSPIEPCGMGTARFFADDVAAPPPIVGGFMTVPKTPGLGVAPDNWDAMP